MKRLIVFLAMSSTVWGQSLWNGILNSVAGTGAVSQSAIDWSQSGVQGGVPSDSWPQCGTTITSTGSDQTSQIQTALGACAANHYVFLAPGTFKITTNDVPTNRELRGSGANQTIISPTGTGQSALTIGCPSGSCGGATYGTPPSITAGATAGSTSITLSSVSGVTAGTYLVVNELNDSAYVSNVGDEGTCSFCGFVSGTRSRGQIVEVENVTGLVVTIFPALYTDYSHTPTAVKFSASAKNAGIRNLQVFANGTQYKDSFYMGACVNCWIVGNEANYANGSSITHDSNFADIQFSLWWEVRDNYFSNSLYHDIGDNDSQIGLNFYSTAGLLQNNICERTHVCFIMEWGPAGNVIAGNLFQGEFDETTATFTLGGFSCHGASPQFNLFEENVGTQFYFDSVWGSCTNNTFFRNWSWGTTPHCAPLTNGRQTVTSCTGGNLSFPYQASRAFQINWLNTYDNFVGNVAGSAYQNNLSYPGHPTTTHVAVLNWASTGAGANRSYDSTNYNFTFGYGTSSDSGAGTSPSSGCDGVSVGPCHSTAPATTAFLHGNYTNADGAINWAAGVTHTLPPSFYLSGKPSWWGSLPWPSMGPDITGGSGAGGHASLAASNPAMNCYVNNMGGVLGGAGTPLPFDPVACYGNTTLPTVAPTTTIFSMLRGKK